MRGRIIPGRTVGERPQLPPGVRRPPVAELAGTPIVGHHDAGDRPRNGEPGLAGYEAAWRAPGTEGLAGLFTGDATYLQSPTNSPLLAWTRSSGGGRKKEKALDEQQPGHRTAAPRPSRRSTHHRSR